MAGISVGRKIPWKRLSLISFYGFVIQRYLTVQFSCYYSQEFEVVWSTKKDQFEVTSPSTNFLHWQGTSDEMEWQ